MAHSLVTYVSYVILIIQHIKFLLNLIRIGGVGYVTMDICI